VNHVVSIKEFADYLDAETGFKVYPLAFPTNAEENSSTVQFSGGNPTRAGIVRANLQVITRATHPAIAEANALEIKELLDGSSDFIVGATNVVLCSANQPFPLFIGTDSNNRYKFSINFSLIMEG
jgi:Bacteriophage minor capsid protein